MHFEDSLLLNRIWKRLKKMLQRLGFLPAIAFIFFPACSPQLPGSREEHIKIYREVMEQIEKLTDAAMIAAKSYEKEVNKL